MIDRWLRNLIISSVIGGYSLAGAILLGLVASDITGLGHVLWEFGGIGVIALLWFFLGMLHAIALAGTGTIAFQPGHRSDGGHPSVSGCYRLVPATQRTDQPCRH